MNKSQKSWLNMWPCLDLKTSHDSHGYVWQ